MVLTGCPAGEALATRDPFDRAHGVRDAIGDGLLPNARRGFHGKVTPLIGSVPRRYHPSQLVAREYETEELTDADGRVVGYRIRRDRRGMQVVTGGIGIDSSFDSLVAAQARLDGIPGIGLKSGGNVNLAERQARALGAMHAVGRSPHQRLRGGEW